MQRFGWGAPGLVLALALALALSMVVLAPAGAEDPHGSARWLDTVREPDGLTAQQLEVASAPLIDPDGHDTGAVVFQEFDDQGVLVLAHVEGMEQGFHGFHIHAGDACTDEDGEPDFTEAGGHHGHDDPDDTPHGTHAGDLPALYVGEDGTAWTAFVTDRFTHDDIIGRTVIVHADPDNLAHIPDRYRLVTDPTHTGPDEASRTTGDAGGRVACGVIEAGDTPLANPPAEIGRTGGVLVDEDLEVTGVVEFAGLADGRTLVSGVIFEGLSATFHGFHVHAGERCVDDEGEADFSEAGGHYGHDDPDDTPHGTHAGDLPPLLALEDGGAYTAFVTDQLEPAEILGRTMIVHADRDNLGHIPDRYVSEEQPGSPGPDAATRATGDAGVRLYCGELESWASGLRLEGVNRYETTVAVSRNSFPEPGSAAAAVLARGDVFADGLAGTPLAVEVGAPLLLSRPDALPDGVADELSRALPDGATVYLLGGLSALSQQVADTVEDLGFETERIAGDTRYETAVAIAAELDDPETVLIATGTRFPDALAAGAAAAVNDGAVLLSRGDRPHPATEAYLEGRDVELHAVGGPAARAYPDATEHSGANRYHTAAEVVRNLFGEDGDLAAGLARGGAAGDDSDQAFADALSGGVHAARIGSPVLLSPSESLHDATQDVLCEQVERIGTVYAYGGLDALAAETLNAAADAASGFGC